MRSAARLLIAAASAGALMFCLVEACGGRLVVGYDDAGRFHTADGSILTYGSVCSTWDASHYADGNYDLTTVCSTTAECVQWFEPPGWTVYSEVCGQPVMDDAGNDLPDVVTCAAIYLDIFPSCDPFDQSANDYCTAYWNQFVSHNQVLGMCQSGRCLFEPNNRCDSIHMLVVLEDGGTSCELPCQP